jgi:hypothetical protein
MRSWRRRKPRPVHVPGSGWPHQLPGVRAGAEEYGDFTEFLKRDVVMLASESTADRCLEAPHWSFVVDVTVEN